MTVTMIKQHQHPVNHCLEMKTAKMKASQQLPYPQQRKFCWALQMLFVHKRLSSCAETAQLKAHDLPSMNLIAI